MSDNLPLEVQEEIMKRLPVKSLIQFRSVSKAWKSLIDSSRFITHYSAEQHLFLVDDHPSYVSIVDDDSFPQQTVSPDLPPLVANLRLSDIIGSSHGLVCLYGDYDEYSDDDEMAVLWNISIRKAVAIAVPKVLDLGIVFGFGVCPKTADPKIVKIAQVDKWSDMESIPHQVEVFTLSTGIWRNPTSNLPRKSIQFGCGQGINGGVIYWLATDTSTTDFKFRPYNLIISFDMATEEFREINLPNSLVYDGALSRLSISSRRKSLVVLEHDYVMDVFVVWMMESGVSNSFSKLFTIRVPDTLVLRVLAFRKSGEPVIEIGEDHSHLYGEPSSLVVYEPNSEHISDIEIHVTNAFNVLSYMETLLLLDQPESAVFDKGKRYIAREELGHEAFEPDKEATLGTPPVLYLYNTR